MDEINSMAPDDVVAPADSDKDEQNPAADSDRDEQSPVVDGEDATPSEPPRTDDDGWVPL